MNSLDSRERPLMRANFEAQSQNEHNYAIDKFAKRAIERERELIGERSCRGLRRLSWAGISPAFRIKKNQHCRARAALAC
jgi:hypothetical protein